ncbi:hypothetical protein BX666DRAFT_1599376 [Dichotomocladium elegans]|nr:hypothetical protein BX666DRAFT_1599376 [Dichotomocladium elegans]
MTCCLGLLRFLRNPTVTKLSRVYSKYMKWPARNAEDTFVHEFISPFLRYIFKDKDLGTFWANTSLQSVTPLPLLQAIPETFGACASEASSSISPPAPKRKRSDKMLPDFNCYGYILGRRFDLFIAEIKPPHSSNAVSDLPKLAKAMKRMIDILVAYGIDQPRVCGLWVQGTLILLCYDHTHSFGKCSGFSCHTYAMDLEYEGIYRMVELDQFHLPRTVADLVLTKHAMECLLKVKGIIIRTLGNINKLNLGNCKQIRSTKPTGVL